MLGMRVHGKLSVHTWNIKSPSSTLDCDWKSSENVSSVTDSVPFFSARLIFFSYILRKLTDNCEHEIWNQQPQKP